MAQQVLTQFEEHPDSWTRVPDILERSSFPQAKVRIVLIPFLNQWILTTYPLHSTLVYRYWKSSSLPGGKRYPKDSDKVRFNGGNYFVDHSLLYIGIRNFVVNVTIKVASDETTLRKEKTYINKLNLALIQARYSQG